MEKLKPYAFEYKDDSKPGTTKGRLVGVMAQDLQRSKEGRKMVRKGPDGLQVDAVKAISAALAAAADLHARMVKLENRAA